jgi:hypothetical protein
VAEQQRRRRVAQVVEAHRGQPSARFTRLSVTIGIIGPPEVFEKTMLRRE